MKALSFVLVDHSTLSDAAHGGPLTPATLAMIAEACQHQLNHAVADEWGGSAAVRADVAANVKPDEIACVIQDSLPDVPGAAGYHATLPNGAPVAYFARADFDSLTSGPTSLGVCVSHELVEVAGDRAANLWSDEGSGTTEKARELCDQVQDTCYPGVNGVDVSNFLLQAAFDPGAPGPYDHLGVLKSQDDYGSGYEIVRSITTQATDLPAGERAAFRVEVRGKPRDTQRARHPSSRRSRRGVRPGRPC